MFRVFDEGLLPLFWLSVFKAAPLWADIDNCPADRLRALNFSSVVESGSCCPAPLPDKAGRSVKRVILDVGSLYVIHTCHQGVLILCLLFAHYCTFAANDGAMWAEVLVLENLLLQLPL